MNTAKIIDYKPISRRNTDELREEVVAALEDGWQLWGSLHSNQYYFCQAVVKYEESQK